MGSPLNPLQVAWPLSPSLVGQAAACLRAPGLIPGPQSFPSVPSPSLHLPEPQKWPSIVSYTISTGLERDFPQSQGSTGFPGWTLDQRGIGELLLQGLLPHCYGCLPPLHLLSHAPAGVPALCLRRGKWDPFQHSQEDPSSQVFLGLSKN